MSIEDNILEIRAELPRNVNLIAVSKTKNIEQIMESYNCGIRDFGENKVQELLSKFEELPKDINWHLIGHLQTNKVKYIVGKVKLIHSLDSIKLTEEIERRYSKENLIANTLIQINIGKEESKTGILEEDLDGLIRTIETCKNVKVIGLMAIIPETSDLDAKKYFEQMHTIWCSLKEKGYENIEMKYLSMGMSSDYKLAIQCGTNMIRIGQGIFGKRDYNN